MITGCGQTIAAGEPVEGRNDYMYCADCAIQPVEPIEGVPEWRVDHLPFVTRGSLKVDIDCGNHPYGKVSA